VELLKQAVTNILENLFVNYPQLVSCRNDIEKAFAILKQCYISGGKVLICGNGGSAADSEHIVGELMKGFMLKRNICNEDVEKIRKAFPEDSEFLSNNLQGALPAISLVSQSAISSAFINDVEAEMVFAQQVYGYLKDEDVVIGLSTSGNAKNVVNAIKVAKAMSAKTIGLTGEIGGIMKDLCDVSIKAPADETYRIQEYHLPIYHALCAMIEVEVFA
jgi:phosphoheptose isomerase